MNTGLARMIDHTLLKANATDEQIRVLCAEADKFGFASVCINPGYVSLAVDLLRGSTVKVCTVVGFPLGANITETKIGEAGQAVEMGANELDYVINVSAVQNGRYDLVLWEMRRFVELRSKYRDPIVIKIILETCYLNNDQIVKVCQLARETGLDFVKTSTGFGTAGATVEHVRLMRNTVGSELGVKASGGIRTLKDATDMVDAGANRIGASAGVAILAEAII